jgi:G:T-mismatch repair DNA endonuclease (very short patch repair protein)
MARDRRVNRVLRRAGWRVVRIWEHELSERGVGRAECGMARWMTKLRRWCAERAV